jgi:hypothetical protein
VFESDLVSGFTLTATGFELQRDNVSGFPSRVNDSTGTANRLDGRGQRLY